MAICGIPLPLGASASDPAAANRQTLLAESFIAFSESADCHIARTSLLAMTNAC